MIIQNEAMLTDAVCADMAATPDERLREVMDVLVRHLHAFVREARPTEEEWDKGLAFVTGLGQATNDTHNETILAARHPGPQHPRRHAEQSLPGAARRQPRCSGRSGA